MPEPVLGQRQTRQRGAILDVTQRAPGPLTVATVTISPARGLGGLYN